MERLKNLDRFQKIILVLAAALVLLFSVLYPVTIARKGFSYRGAILVPKQSGGDTVYSGSIGGEHASFTVYADKTVEFRYQGKLYGPYTVREDSTAVPHNSALGVAQDGIELREGETTLFRGVVRREDQFITLYHEDGSVESELAVGKISVYVENGVTIGEDGKILDTMEPSITEILDLMNGPELTHKGEGWGWFAGVVVCAVTAACVLFAEELFWLKMSLHIDNADNVSPSEWELMGRRVSWGALLFMALVIFIEGLK